MTSNRFVPPRRPDQPNPAEPDTGRHSRFLRGTASNRAPARQQHPDPTPPSPPPVEPGIRLDRRTLIAAGAVAGAGVVGGAVWLATRDGEEPADVPSTQVAEASPTTPPATSAPQPTLPPGEPIEGERALVETTVADLGVYIERRQVSAVALVDAATSRYSRYDATFHAVIELNPDAAEIATALDDELARGQRRGPLHGMPVLLKDVVATDDRTLTTAGALALALAGNRVVEDATIVRRLREAGAVPLGKTNMSEWSGVRANGQVPGWSGRGGQTRNPYDPKMSCWGSSSGSAAAVALNYAPFAIGVETNGSIVAPAAACGIVGLKPTVGLVSRVGVMPVSMTWDSPGPMARNVADVAAVMNVIAGYDPEDPAYGELGWSSPASTAGGSPVHEFDEVDYTEALDPDAIRGARLGVCWHMWGIDPDADKVAYAVIDRLKAEMGVEIVEGVPMPPLENPEMLDGSPEMVNAEFASGMEAFFARYTPDGQLMSLPDVAAWNAEHPDAAMATIGQEGLVETEWALSLDDPEYLEILTRVTAASRDEGVDAVMNEYDLDALISPTAAVPTPIDPPEPFPGAASKVSAMSGYPGITIPAAYVRGLPVGLYLVGRAFSERQLIGYAYAIEQMLQARVPVKL
jgi:amidase